MSWSGCLEWFILDGTDQYCPAPFPFNCKEWYDLTQEEKEEIKRIEDEVLDDE